MAVNASSPPDDANHRGAVSAFALLSALFALIPTTTPHKLRPAVNPVKNLQLRRRLGIPSFLLVACVLVCHAQEPLFSQGSLNRDWTVPSSLLARFARDTVTHVSRRRANVIGATTGAIIGGLGSAAFILNALAPHCVIAVSTVSSSHCGHRSRIVALEVVTIAAGTTVGAVGGAFGARRIARWWGNRTHDARPDRR